MLEHYQADALTHSITGIKSDIQELERRLKESQAQQPHVPTDLDAMVTQMVEDLQNLGKELQPQDVPHIRRLLGLLVTRMEADPETKVVEVEFALPSWMGQVLRRHGAVGLDAISAYKTFNEAHRENDVILGIFRCDGEGRPVCYTCRRMRAAA